MLSLGSNAWAFAEEQIQQAGGVAKEARVFFVQRRETVVDASEKLETCGADTPHGSCCALLSPEPRKSYWLVVKGERAQEARESPEVFAMGVRGTVSGPFSVFVVAGPY